MPRHSPTPAEGPAIRRWRRPHFSSTTAGCLRQCETAVMQANRPRVAANRPRVGSGPGWQRTGPGWQRTGLGWRWWVTWSGCSSRACPTCRVAGEVIHARDPFEEPAGGGAVAAVQLARLAGECHPRHRAGRRRARPPVGGAPERARRACVGSRACRRHPYGRDARGRHRRAHDHHLRSAPRALRATTRSCRGVRSREWTPCTSRPATWVPCAPRAERGCWWPARGRSDALGQGVPLDALVLSGDDAIERRAHRPCAG